MRKEALLAVSFGTADSVTRKKTIEAIEKSLQEAFPQRTLYTAWGSHFLIRKVAQTEHLSVDTAEEALEKMCADGVRDVLIQPTFFTCGVEYDRLCGTVEERKADFEKIAVGRPLLASEEDAEAAADVLAEIFAGLRSSDALILMGHGWDHPGSRIYGKLEDCLRRKHHPNMLVPTVEGRRTLRDILPELRERKPGTVYLTPLMVVAGNHAVVDMAGDGEDSWKSVLEKEGFHVQCILKGMGEYPAMRRLYVQHAEQAAAGRA